MPKRILDDSLLDSRSLEVLSPRAQDAFPRFILLADDFGCFEVNVVRLRANGWSRRPDVTEEDVGAWVTEYAERQAVDPETGARLPPILMLWTHVGRRYAHLTGWFGPHGQKRRAEYDPQAPAGTPGRHGSKRKTPAPPADLLAAVLAGEVRPIDGKPPGTDREPTGNEESESSNDSTPAREPTGNPAGSDRDGAGKCSVPAPAVPVAVPDAAAAGEAPLPPTGRLSPLPRKGEALAARWARYPAASQLYPALVARWPHIARSPIETDIEALDARCRARGAEAFARDCIVFAEERGTDPSTTTYFARCLADIGETPDPAPARAPGEIPRWGDSDFDDPAAYPDWNAYQARSAPASAVPIVGPAVRRVDP